MLRRGARPSVQAPRYPSPSEAVTPENWALADLESKSPPGCVGAPWPLSGVLYTLNASDRLSCQTTSADESAPATAGDQEVCSAVAGWMIDGPEHPPPD